MEGNASMVIWMEYELYEKPLDGKKKEEGKHISMPLFERRKGVIPISFRQQTKREVNTIIVLH